MYTIQQKDNIIDTNHQLMELYENSQLTVPQYEVAKNTVKKMMAKGFLRTGTVFFDPCYEEENILLIFMFRKLTRITGNFVKVSINEVGEIDIKKYY